MGFAWSEITQHVNGRNDLLIHILSSIATSSPHRILNIVLIRIAQVHRIRSLCQKMHRQADIFHYRIWISVQRLNADSYPAIEWRDLTRLHSEH